MLCSRQHSRMTNIQATLLISRIVVLTTQFRKQTEWDILQFCRRQDAVVIQEQESLLKYDVVFPLAFSNDQYSSHTTDQQHSSVNSTIQKIYRLVRTLLLYETASCCDLETRLFVKIYWVCVTFFHQSMINHKML